ncbi:hypothetical protein D9M69_348980 [compost metagenome]
MRNAYPQPQPGGLGHALELRGQGPEEVVQRVDIQVRLDRALVQLGNIQQVGEQVFGAFQGLVGALHQLLLGRRQPTLAQGRDQQARGIERLQQVVAGGGQVLVLGEVGGLGGVPRLAQLRVQPLQLAGAREHPLLQFVVQRLQALLGQDALGDIGDEAFHQFLFIGLEQQVHQHVDMAAVLAHQPRLVAEQPAFALQGAANLHQLGSAADEQLVGQIDQRPKAIPRRIVTEHLRQGRVGGTHAVLQAGLENPVYRVLEQPFVAIALGLQLLQPRQQLRVVALARGMAAQAEQPGEGLALLVRGPRHRPPRHPAGWIRAGW